MDPGPETPIASWSPRTLRSDRGWSESDFATTDEPTVVLGHTHMPFDRLADRRSRGAFWVLLGPDITLRRTDYDVNVAAEMFRIVAPDYPGLCRIIEENLLTVPSDAEALAVFSQWARRSDEHQERSSA